MSDDRAVGGAAERNPRDPRVRRTRAALRSAFNRLFLDEGYDAITPARVAAAAAIGRSTFYEHFPGKDALLRHSVAPLLLPLAEAAAGRQSASLIGTLRHFWENRRLARKLLADKAGRVIHGHLAELIERTLVTSGHIGGRTGVLPPRLTATGTAAAQLALIEAWLSGRTTCTLENLAEALVTNFAFRAARAAPSSGYQSRSASRPA